MLFLVIEMFWKPCQLCSAIDKRTQHKLLSVWKGLTAAYTVCISSIIDLLVSYTCNFYAKVHTEAVWHLQVLCKCMSVVSKFPDALLTTITFIGAFNIESFYDHREWQYTVGKSSKIMLMSKHSTNNHPALYKWQWVLESLHLSSICPSHHYYLFKSLMFKIYPHIDGAYSIQWGLFSWHICHKNIIVFPTLLSSCADHWIHTVV